MANVPGKKQIFINTSVDTLVLISHFFFINLGSYTLHFLLIQFRYPILGLTKERIAKRRKNDTLSKDRKPQKPYPITVGSNYLRSPYIYGSTPHLPGVGQVAHLTTCLAMKILWNRLTCKHFAMKLGRLFLKEGQKVIPYIRTAVKHKNPMPLIVFAASNFARI